jgi:hypothetical protein
VDGVLATCEASGEGFVLGESDLLTELSVGDTDGLAVLFTLAFTGFRSGRANAGTERDTTIIARGKSGSKLVKVIS